MDWIILYLTYLIFDKIAITWLQMLRSSKLKTLRLYFLSICITISTFHEYPGETSPVALDHVISVYLPLTSTCHLDLFTS
jgi:putative effector of murein hydrolase LrgA (UPF0299 family)